jgi:hypothetical protein
MRLLRSTIFYMIHKPNTKLMCDILLKSNWRIQIATPKADTFSIINTKLKLKSQHNGQIWSIQTLSG